MKKREDKEAEAIIKRFGLKFSTKEIPFAAIDEKESLKHSGRLDAPVDQDLVQQYREAMKRDDEPGFPMMVTCLIAEDTYMLLGGNHRYQAMKGLGLDKIWVYVVEGMNDETKEMLPRALNGRHGKMASKEERLKFAVMAAKKYGWPPAKAAEILSLPEGSIRSALRASEVSSSLASNRISTQGLTQAHLLALAKIGNERVRAELVRAVQSCNLTSEMISDHAREVECVKSSELDQLAKVAEIAKKYSVGQSLSKKIQQNTADDKKSLVRVLNQAERIIREKNGFAQFGLDGDQTSKEIKGRWRALAEKILSWC